MKDTSAILRKIYSRHGLCNWAQAVDIIEGVESILVEASENEKACQDSCFLAIMQIIETHKKKRHEIPTN